MITPAQSSNTILKLVDSAITNAKIIPVLVIDNADHAVDLAKTLVDAGLPILEVTLRTPAALKAMERMASVEGAIVAAGTVLTEQHVNDCKSAGAEFLVSLGSTESLINAATTADMPLLPGAATASEMMHLLEKGFRFLKFYPAIINGGVAALNTFASPLPKITFCPTGGVSSDNMNDYLSLPNVACAGGSWLVTAEDLKNKNWKGIAKKAALLDNNT
jgi:2-dehydro-3-deoxyphosphogluconate aldolase/(4S)-4-hydroxy-2-oxoglutarate aldolase